VLVERFLIKRRLTQAKFERCAFRDQFDLVEADVRCGAVETKAENLKRGGDVDDTVFAFGSAS
jgi:hypothetical protein